MPRGSLSARIWATVDFNSYGSWYWRTPTNRIQSICGILTESQGSRHLTDGQHSTMQACGIEHTYPDDFPESSESAVTDRGFVAAENGPARRNARGRLGEKNQSRISTGSITGALPSPTNKGTRGVRCRSIWNIPRSWPHCFRGFLNHAKRAPFQSTRPFISCIAGLDRSTVPINTYTTLEQVVGSAGFAPV